MTGLLGFLALLALVVIAAWLFGSFVLRVVGLFFVVGGLLTTVVAGRPGVLPMVLIGGVLWLAGHWVHAYRHHTYLSPLAERIFLQVLPRRFDPTRGWGIPVIDVRRDEW